MKKLLFGSLAVGLIAGPALAGSSATVTPIDGTMGSYFDNGQLSGHSFNFAPGGGAGGIPPGNLYDNIPTFLGGTADPGLYGPFGSIPGTFLFVDWTSPSAQWGDDLHGVSAGGAGPAVVTSLWYGYSNSVTGSNVHVIKIYDMVPPSVPHTSPGGATFVTITKGALLTQVTLAGLPSGQNFVSVAIPSVQLPGSAVWVKLEELPQGTGFPGTFWLTGGTPGVGTSHDGLTFTIKDYYPTYYGGTFTYNTFANFPNFTFSDGQGGYLYTGANVSIGLGGYHVPGPAAISLLGLGGLVALRRRRVR